MSFPHERRGIGDSVLLSKPVYIFNVLTTNWEVGPYPVLAVPELQLDVALALLAVLAVSLLIIEGWCGVVLVLESGFGSFLAGEFPVEVVGVPGFVYTDCLLLGSSADVRRELREFLIEVLVLGVFIISRRMNERLKT